MLKRWRAYTMPCFVLDFLPSCFSCRTLSKSKKIKHLTLASNNLNMARNGDVEGALENVATLNLANTQTGDKVTSCAILLSNRREFRKDI